jgi:hypothetical protein
MSSKYISTDLRNLVASRANYVCEYCLISEEDTFFGCQVEHIISRKHGGRSEPENLAYSCVFCNRFKGSDITSLSAETSELIRFYNPRIDRWREHFILIGVTIMHNTAMAEATVRILQMNSEERLLEREILRRRSRYLSESALLLIAD